MSNYTLKANVHYGQNTVLKIGEICEGFGRKACIVADPFFAGGEVLERMIGLLHEKGIASVCFSDFRSDPDCTDVDKCVPLILAENCDFVIALGGGSGIDTAKSAAMVAKNGGLCWDYCAQKLPDGSMGAPKTPQMGALPIVAIATTAGTGSEVSHGSVISNRALGVKSGVAGRFLIPCASIVDPVLTLTLPPEQTAYTGFDAFSHAFESYMLGYSTYLSEITALASIKLIGEALVVAVRDGSNLEARSKMSNASTLGGFNIALTDTSVGHILGSALSAKYHMIHGATLSVLMDSIVEWILPNAQERIARVALLFDPSLEGKSEKKQAAMLPEILRELKRQIGIDKRLGDYGVKKEDVPALVDHVVDSFPIDSTIFTAFAQAPQREDLENILRNSF